MGLGGKGSELVSSEVQGDCDGGEQLNSLGLDVEFGDVAGTSAKLNFSQMGVRHEGSEWQLETVGKGKQVYTG